MKRAADVPEDAVRIERYEELEHYAVAFAGGHLSLLVVLGRRGLQKSRTFRAVMPSESCWIRSHAKGYAIYQKLLAHQNQPVVIDDVDGLYADSNVISLLKCLCETETTKVVEWNSNAAIRDGLPTSFVTSSHVALIANRWRTLNTNVEALTDRGHVLYFAPPPREVHRRVAEWFWDEEVYRFIGEHLQVIGEPTMRDYHRAWEQKKAGLPWREYLLGRWLGDATTQIVARYLSDGSYRTEKERVDACHKATGISRSTFYEHKRRITPSCCLPDIALRRSAPPLRLSGT